jgi:transcriptional regulator with XRE-family HTH domain
MALGVRLREIRIEAGLSGRDLSRKMGRHPSKISRIEHGRATPTAADIHAWCSHCGVPDQEPDLVASMRAVEGIYLEWRQLVRCGLRQLQEYDVPLYERTRHFRIYEPGLVPGLLQTPAYTTALMKRIVAFSGVTDDVEDAVAARIRRQRVLTSGEHRFAIVLEEWALRARLGSAEIMTGQLGHLLTVATLPSVSLGIIPTTIERTMWPSPGFWIFDDSRVHLETPTAELTITQPREVDIYLQTFAALASMATHGATARALITKAIDQLDA